MNMNSKIWEMKQCCVQTTLVMTVCMTHNCDTSSDQVQADWQKMGETKSKSFFYLFK